MKPPLDCKFAMIANGVLFDDGLLYFLGRGPDRLLRFDRHCGYWEELDVSLPASSCLDLLAFEGKLFLVGAAEVMEEIYGVGIWELDLERMEWRVCCFMPDDVFEDFSRGGMNHFQTVAHKGKICFAARKRSDGASILMCDLSAKRWWWPCASARRDFGMHFMHAIVPYVELLKPKASRHLVDEER